MKNLVLLLVFLNVVYFFWGVTTKQSPKQVQQADPVETLVLIPKAIKKEVPKKAAVKSEKKLNLVKVNVPAVKKYEAPKKTQAELYCVEISDYESELLAQQSSARLLATAHTEKKEAIVVMRPKIKQDYWVIYPAEEDWEASKTNVEMIKSKGITDLWLVPSGENKGIISLGLFAGEKQAKLSAESLLQKGLEVNIVKREKEVRRYLILLKSTNSDDVLEGYIKSTLDRLDLRINKISC